MERNPKHTTNGFLVPLDNKRSYWLKSWMTHPSAHVNHYYMSIVHIPLISAYIFDHLVCSYMSVLFANMYKYTTSSQGIGIGIDSLRIIILQRFYKRINTIHKISNPR